MGALAQRESSSDSFVGRVLHRSSPVLTWRPNGVLRIRAKAQAPGDETGTPESTVQRISRVPTRRVVAWPLVPNVGRERSRAVAWSVGAHVAIALVLASVVALGIVALDGDGSGVAGRLPAATRVASSHTFEESRVDALVADPLAELGDVTSMLPPPAVAAAPRPAQAAHAQAAHHGRPHPGHRHGRVASH